MKKLILILLFFTFNLFPAQQADVPMGYSQLGARSQPEEGQPSAKRQKREGPDAKPEKAEKAEMADEQEEKNQADHKGLTIKDLPSLLKSLNYKDSIIDGITELKKGNKKKAIEQLEFVSSQTEDLNAKANADLHLGFVFLNDDKNLKAKEYFLAAFRQSVNNNIRSKASYYLGLVTYNMIDLADANRPEELDVSETFEAIEYFEYAAQDPIYKARACYRLALINNFSPFVEKDANKIRKYLEEALNLLKQGMSADDHYAEMQIINCLLGEIYLEEYEDYVQAGRHYEAVFMAPRQDDSVKELLKNLKKKQEQNPSAACAKAIQFVEHSEARADLELQKKLMPSSFFPKSLAAARLGYMYTHGKGVQPDYIKARQYFELVVPNEQINFTVTPYACESSFGLGWLFYKGLGLDKPDINKAKMYFKKAASILKNPIYEAKANKLLGDIYFSEKDYVKALNCFQLAFKQTKDESMAKEILKAVKLLGDIFCTKNDYQNSLNCFQFAFSQTEDESMIKEIKQAFMKLKSDWIKKAPFKKIELKR